jgi:DNA-binding transcriptional LysR family regulator
MDIRSLACFVAVAEDLHFRRAADRLNMTQPSLSQRIRVLEEEVGVELFVRDRRHVALTPAGEAFLEPARRSIESATVAKEQALRAMRGEVGRLRLGFTVIAFYGRLPEAVRMFRQKHPDIEVELVEMISPLLEDALLGGTLDLAVLHPPLENPQLFTHPLPPERLVLALPSNHRLAERGKIQLTDLADEPLLLAPRRIGPHFFDRLIGYFQSKGITPNVVQEVSPMTSLSALVAAGTGVGFVTEGLSRIPRPGVAYRDITPEPPGLPIAFSWQTPSLPPCAKRFLDMAVNLTEDRSRKMLSQSNALDGLPADQV